MHARAVAVCHERCPHGKVDSLSASLVSRQVPQLLQINEGSAGVVIASETDYVCAFPAE